MTIDQHVSTSRLLRRPGLPALLLGVLALALLPGCEGVENGGYGHPLIWPQAARLGDSVAFLVGTNIAVNDAETFDLSLDNLEIRLSHGTTVEPAEVISVIETPLAPTAIAASTKGIFALWAIFKLPAAWPGDIIPTTLTVTAVRDGIPSASYVNTLDILGTGGSPTEFSAWFPPSSFASNPTLRLRPKWNGATGLGFDPAWNIAGVEFTLRYPVGPGSNPPGGISNPRASASGDATGALVVAGPEATDGSTKTTKVMLVAPNGFQLAYGCSIPPCPIGRGPMIDIVFDKSSTSIEFGAPVFETSSFTIEDLKVWDRDGVRLDAPGAQASDFFKLFVVRNLSTGA